MAKNAFSIAPEPISKIEIFGNELIISNSLFTTVLVCVFLILVGLVLRLFFIPNLSKTPTKGQVILEFITKTFVDNIKTMTGRSRLPAILYGICGFFFSYIVIASLMGLLPGVSDIYIKNYEGEKVHLLRASTTDLSATSALSVIAFILVQLQGVKNLKLSYFKKFFNFGSPLKFVVGLLELLSEFTRLLSFSLRLFGNIFAGEVLLTVVKNMSKFGYENIDFVGFPFPVVIISLEAFVAFIQAYVFVSLFLVFSTLAKEEAH